MGALPELDPDAKSWIPYEALQVYLTASSNTLNQFRERINQPTPLIDETASTTTTPAPHDHQ